MRETENAVEIHGLTKRYKDFTLDNISLTLPKGCILGLIGENGAGKSTTLKLLLGMLRPDGGGAELLGTPLSGNITERKDEIGVVLGEPGIPWCMSARQAEKVFGKIYSSWDSELYFSLMKKLSVPENKPYRDFSRGMKMKLGICAALSHAPKLLILDEPTSGLDPVVRDEVVDMLLDFTRDPEHSVLISSHIVSDLEKLCDYIAFLHKGRLVLCEEKDVLLGEYGLLQCAEDELEDIRPEAVIGKRVSRYGCSLIVRRSGVPEGFSLLPVSIEELFIFMAKEENV